MAATVQHRLKGLKSYIANPNPSTFSIPIFTKSAILQFNLLRISPSFATKRSVLTTTRFLETPLRALRYPQSQELYRLISVALTGFVIDPYICKEYLIPRVFNQAVNRMAKHGKNFKGFLRLVFYIVVRVSDEELDDRKRLIKSEEIEKCPVCLDDMLDDPMVSCSCHHRFHESCMSKWLKKQNSCPICRGIVLPRLLYLAKDEHDQLSTYLLRPARFVIRSTRMKIRVCEGAFSKHNQEG